MKNITILGSTGSIGVNALNVIDNLDEDYKVFGLSAYKNIDTILAQIKKYKPEVVAVADLSAANSVKEKLNNYDVSILSGRSGLLELASRADVDILLNALVGSSGMEPTICAIKSSVDVALSNKESLVMAGEIIESEKNKSGAKIFPVDSEHSAIWQCLVGEKIGEVEKIILTGSGGPFRTRDINTLIDVKIQDALNHPNWEMGKKISIDSSSLMNKGLEVIEAKFLFDIDIKDIDVVIHPESIIHSMVQFNDGSIIAQLGEPDMRLPIQYALGYPERLNNSYKRYDFINSGSLNFEKPCYKTFNNLKLAFDAAEKEGNSPCILNAANEVVVSAFLEDKIKFLDMTYIIEESLNKISYIANPNLDQLIETDRLTREYTLEKIKKY